MKPKPHGGKRPGAGRKPGRKTVQIRVYEETAQRIERVAKRIKSSNAHALEHLAAYWPTEPIKPPQTF